ncbi:MAG: hypothetical protein ABF946_10055 [Acetobacter papayae]
MKDILQDALGEVERDAYERVMFDRARHTLAYLRDITSSDPAAIHASISDLIGALEDLVE